MPKPKPTASISPNMGSAPTTEGVSREKWAPVFALRDTTNKESPSLAGGEPLSLPLLSPRLTAFLLRTNKLIEAGVAQALRPFFVFRSPLRANVLGAVSRFARAPAGARSRLRPFGPFGLFSDGRNYAFSAAITKSAHRSPIMMLGALVLPLTILGITLASATHRPSSPLSLSVGSTTASASAPIRQVPTG